MFMQIIEIFISVLCMSVVGITGDEPTNPLDKAQELTAMQALVEQAAPEKVTAEEAQATATEQIAEAPAAEATAVPATQVNQKASYDIAFKGTMTDGKDVPLDYDSENDFYLTKVVPQSSSDTFIIKKAGSDDVQWGGDIYYDDRNHGKCYGSQSGHVLKVPSADSFQLCVKYIDDNAVTIYVNRTPEIDLYYTGDMLSPIWDIDESLTYNETHDYYYAQVTPTNAEDKFKVKGPGPGVWTINWGVTKDQKIAYDDKNRAIFNGIHDGDNINVPSNESFRLYVKYFTTTEADIYVNIEPPDPATKKVSINLDGGDITDEEKVLIKEKGWAQFDYPTSDNYIKYVKIGTKFNVAVEPWNEIHPEKSGLKQTGWSPPIEDDTSVIVEDIVFTAQYVQPVVTKWEVVVTLGDDGQITPEEEKKVKEDGWDREALTKAPTYKKLIDDGTPCLTALEVWTNIKPTSLTEGKVFKGWQPSFDSTPIHEGKKFLAIYAEQPTPVLAKVTVNLNGGTITAAEAKYIASKGWEAAAGAGDSLYLKGFELGTKYKEAMEEWSEIIPTKGSSTFASWDPKPDATKINKDTTFKAQYQETPVPITYTVKVDLNGGSITDEEAASLETAGWKTTKFFNTPIYTKDFDEGTTYSKIMELWLLIEPTKDGKDFNGWDPHPGTTKLEAPITFKAQYTDTPQPQQFEVAVYLDGGTVTAKEEIALIDDGWKSTNVFSDNPSYTKLIDEGTTYIQAMAIWAYISPSKTDYKFSGWLPELGSQTLDADTGFTAQYQSDQPEPGPTPDPDPDDPTTPANVLAGLVQTADNLPPAAIALIFLGAALCVMVIAFASKKNEAHNIN